MLTRGRGRGQEQPEGLATQRSLLMVTRAVSLVWPGCRPTRRGHGSVEPTERGHLRRGEWHGALGRHLEGLCCRRAVLSAADGGPVGNHQRGGRERLLGEGACRGVGGSPEARCGRSTDSDPL